MDHSWGKNQQIMDSASRGEYILYVNKFRLVQQLYHSIWQQYTLYYLTVWNTVDYIDDNVV
jgi:hypothetical protein